MSGEGTHGDDLAGRCVERAPVPASHGLLPARGRRRAREAHAPPSGPSGSGQGVNEKEADHAREERVIGLWGEREGGARSGA